MIMRSATMSRGAILMDNVGSPRMDNVGSPRLGPYFLAFYRPYPYLRTLVGSLGVLAPAIMLARPWGFWRG